MKVSEATGVSLDWMVAKASGLDYYQPEYGPSEPEFSTDWAQGGPIIHREKIATEFCHEDCSDEPWSAWVKEGKYSFGPTPLIAACRCYVASKLGDEVEVPEGL